MLSSLLCSFFCFVIVHALQQKPFGPKVNAYMVILQETIMDIHFTIFHLHKTLDHVYENTHHDCIDM